MTKDLRDDLREAVTCDEPPMMLSAHAVRIVGRRARAKRRLVTAAAVAAVGAVGGFAVIGSTLMQQDRENQSVDAAASDFEPAQLAAAIEAAAAGVDNSARSTASPFLETSVAAYDSQDNEIPDANRNMASVWRSEFAWSADHSLSIYLFRADGSSDLKSEDEACARSVELGAMLSCDAILESDGSISVTELQPVRFDGSYWVWVMPGDKVNAERLAYERTITNVRPDGVKVSATERVRAGSIGQAEKNWVATVDALREVAMNPDLSFPEPPPGEGGCGWVVPAKSDLYNC